MGLTTKCALFTLSCFFTLPSVSLAAPMTAEYCDIAGIPIPSSGTTTDTLTIPDSGVILDIDVLVQGTHTWMQDLSFTLTNPDSGTNVTFIDQVCSSLDDFYVTLDDESPNGLIGTNCPITDGLAYEPSNPLNVFDGELLAGDWTLDITDHTLGDSGILTAWCITATYDDDDFTLSSDSDLTPSACVGDIVEIDVDVGPPVFTDPVTLSFQGLPSNFFTGFTANPVTPASSDGSSLAQVVSTLGTSAKTYPFEIKGAAALRPDKTIPVSLELFDAPPGGIVLLQTPADSAVDQPLFPTFSWSNVAQAETYTIEIATDPGFSTIVDNAVVSANSFTPANPLEPSITYYWRVRPNNACGAGSSSWVFSFTTATVVTHCSATGYTIPPSGGGSTTTDSISIPGGGYILDLDVSVEGEHSWIGDLVFTLSNPNTGTNVTFIDQVCNNLDDFYVTLDDESPNGLIGTNCPIRDGLAYEPSNPLNVFDGEPLVGLWTLAVEDTFLPGDNGTLDFWCISAAYSSNPPTNCDGADVYLTGETVPAITSLTCDVGDIHLQNVGVEGHLIINKTGRAYMDPSFRVTTGGRLEINNAEIN